MPLKRKISMTLLALALAAGSLASCGGSATAASANTASATTAAQTTSAAAESAATPVSTTVQSSAAASESAVSESSAGSESVNVTIPEPGALQEPTTTFVDFANNPAAQQKIQALLDKMEQGAASLHSYKVRSLIKQNSSVSSGEITDEADVILSPQFKTKGQSTSLVFGMENKSAYYNEKVGTELIFYSDSAGEWVKDVWPGELGLDQIGTSVKYLQKLAAQNINYLELRSEKTDVEGIACAELALGFTSSWAASANQSGGTLIGENVFYVALDNGYIVRTMSESKSGTNGESTTTAVADFSSFNQVADFTIPEEVKNAKTMEELYAGFLPEASSETAGSSN